MVPVDRRSPYRLYAMDRAAGIRPESDEANYGFLVYELNGSEQSALAHLKKTGSLEEATKASWKSSNGPALPTSIAVLLGQNAQ